MNTLVRRNVVKEAGRCELCGSRRNLEAHHIIPLVCGGPDEEANLICLCKGCHAKLTPGSLLTKMGLRNVKTSNVLVHFRLSYYASVHRFIEEYEAVPTCSEMLDIIDGLTNDYIDELRRGKKGKPE